MSRFLTISLEAAAAFISASARLSLTEVMSKCPPVELSLRSPVMLRLDSRHEIFLWPTYTFTWTSHLSPRLLATLLTSGHDECHYATEGCSWCCSWLVFCVGAGHGAVLGYQLLHTGARPSSPSAPGSAVSLQELQTKVHEDFTN